jgi:hypothetical protein
MEVDGIDLSTLGIANSERWSWLTPSPAPGAWYRPDPRRSWAGDPEEFRYPVRVNRTKRVIGMFPSLITKRSQPFHSFLELDALCLIDLTLWIVAIHAQPRSFEYRLDGERHKYTPDLIALLADGREFALEVKYYDDACSPKNRARWPAIKAALAHEGLGLKILTDRHIRKEPRYSNTIDLQAYRTMRPEEGGLASRIDEALCKTKQLTLRDIFRNSNDAQFAHDTVMALIVHRHLWVDLDLPIDLETVVCHASCGRRGCHQQWRER